MSNSAAGASVEDASIGPITIRSLTIGDTIVLKVAANCRHGATINFPNPAADQVAEASTADGKLAAVVLHPRQQRFTVTVTPDTGATYAVTVNLV